MFIRITEVIKNNSSSTLSDAGRGIILLWELGPASIIFNRFDSKSQFWVEFTLKATSRLQMRSGLMEEKSQSGVK